MSDIVLCCAEEDSAVAGVLLTALRDRGLSVFWYRDAPPGIPWLPVLMEELKSAGCVLVIWSPNSIRSEWVIEEATVARKRRVLVPVRIDIGTDDIPLPFGAVQTMDLTGWRGSTGDERFVALLGGIEQILDKPVNPIIPPPPPPPPPISVSELAWGALRAVLYGCVIGVIFAVVKNIGADAIAPGDPRPLAPTVIKCIGIALTVLLLLEVWSLLPGVSERSALRHAVGPLIVLLGYGLGLLVTPELPHINADAIPFVCGLIGCLLGAWVGESVGGGSRLTLAVCALGGGTIGAALGAAVLFLIAGGGAPGRSPIPVYRFLGGLLPAAALAPRAFLKRPLGLCGRG